VRKVAARVLEGVGFEILPARDGNEAVEIFCAHADRITAVVLDLTMPGMNGDEVLQHIRARRPDVCVLLSSGYEPESMAQLEEGVTFLRKPWSPSELVDALRASNPRSP
jgi:CheY-like chemotaxis protein